MEDLQQRLEDFKLEEIPNPTRLNVNLIDGKKTRGDKRSVFGGLEGSLTIPKKGFIAHFRKTILIREVKIVFEHHAPEDTYLVLPQIGSKSQHRFRTRDENTISIRPNEFSKSIVLEFKQKNQKIKEISVLYTSLLALNHLSKALSIVPKTLATIDDLYTKTQEAAKDAREAKHELEDNLEHIHGEISEKKDTLENLKVEISENAATVDVQSRELESLSNKQLAVEERLQQTKSELSTKTKELNKTAEELRSLKSSIEQYPDSLQGYREEASQFVETYKTYIAWSFGALIAIILGLAAGGLFVAFSEPFDIYDALSKIIIRAPVVLTLGFVSYLLIKFINRLFSLIEEFNKKSSRLTQVSVLATQVGDSAELVSSELSIPKNRLKASEAYDKAVSLKLKLLSRELGKYDDDALIETPTESDHKANGSVKNRSSK